MSTIKAVVFGAFRSAGMSDDEATPAAHARNRRGSRVLALETDVTRFQAIAVCNLALTMAVLLKLFIH